ncbi:MAG: CPBP family intramembrane metalloprotease [Phycisphaeraceae bacterium]|nr:CPBP family intramembrane metalloprotease [Phycisphaeraceae bacterium]
MTDPRHDTPAPHATASSPRGPLSRLDRWMASHPWHPRLAPYLLYLLVLALILELVPLQPRLYPFLYTLQCALVLYLLHRYRSLLPELSLRFHWLAIPTGVIVFIAWVLLGWLMAGEFHDRWTALLQGRLLGPLSTVDAPVDFRHPDQMGPTIGWLALVLRLLGMSLVVPLFEELFIRSLCLRSFHSLRTTAIGVLHFLMDLPLLGDWLMQTSLGERAGRHDPVLGRAFTQTPLGDLSLFGVIASTLVFMSAHIPRDWPAVWVCGIAYCLLLRATAQKHRLGPVIWAHAITNALLWLYTLTTADWQFL